MPLSLWIALVLSCSASVHGITQDRERYGVVMLDEAQDTNPVAVRFLEDQPRVAKLLVGDSRQAINGWRGKGQRSELDHQHTAD